MLGLKGCCCESDMPLDKLRVTIDITSTVPLFRNPDLKCDLREPLFPPPKFLHFLLFLNIKNKLI